MAEVDNQAQVRVINEEVRPLCEAIRGLVARYGAMAQRWDANAMGDLADADTFSRDDVPTLTVAQVKAIRTAFDALNQVATADAAAVAVINRACVRPLVLGA